MHLSVISQFQIANIFVDEMKIFHTYIELSSFIDWVGLDPGSRGGTSNCDQVEGFPMVQVE